MACSKPTAVASILYPVTLRRTTRPSPVEYSERPDTGGELRIYLVDELITRKWVDELLRAVTLPPVAQP